MKKLLIILIASFSFLYISNVRAYSTTNPTNFTDNDFIIVNTFGLTKEEIKEYTTSFPMGTASQDTIVNSIILLRNYYLENLASTYDYYFISIYSDNGDLTGRSGVYGVWLSVFNEEELASSKNIMANSTLYSQVTSLNFNQLSNSSIKNVFITHNGTSVSKMTNYLIYQGLVRANESSPTSFIKMSRYYETNYSFDVYLSDSNDTYTFSKFTYNDTTYNPGEFLFNTLESNDINIVKSSEPKLEYKTGFTSSEAYSVLGKISNNFIISDNNFILEYRNYKFKLQFGSNDFTEENIPVFSHYKIFGLNRGTNTWEELDQYFDNNFFKLDIIETTYDYSENMLADASITMQLNFNSSDEEIETFNTLYSKIKLEFYLENTQNGYIYCYDNLSSSNWEDTPKFLEDHIYYYFPSNYKYAYIVNKNSELNEGKIYYPTNSTNNPLVKLQGQYYNYTLKNYGVPLFSKIYDQDDYYSYIDFSFDNKSHFLALNKIQGEYLYTSWYNPSFLEHWYDSLSFDYISISENTYFYAPIGYDIYFSNGSDTTEIVLPSGNISIDNNNINNNYESSVNDNNLFGIIKDMNVDNNILIYFTNVYNSIRNTNLGQYIFILIINSIILLLIKAAKR